MPHATKYDHLTREEFVRELLNVDDPDDLLLAALNHIAAMVDEIEDLRNDREDLLRVLDKHQAAAAGFREVVA